MNPYEAMPMGVDHYMRARTASAALIAVAKHTDFDGWEDTATEVPRISAARPEVDSALHEELRE